MPSSGLVSIAVPFVVSIGHKMSSFIFENGAPAPTVPQNAQSCPNETSAGTGGSPGGIDGGVGVPAGVGEPVGVLPVSIPGVSPARLRTTPLARDIAVTTRIR